MFKIISTYLTKILAVAAVGASVAAFVLWLHVGSLQKENTLLEADIASKEVQITELKSDQELKDKILIQNGKDREQDRKEVSKLKSELTRLTNEANDKCMDTPLSDPIIQRLRSIANKD